MGKRASRVETLWIISSKDPAIAKLRSAADVHEVAGDESRLVRNQKSAGIGDGVTLGAIAQRMDFIEVTLGGIRVRLFGAPLAKHGRPGAGRTNRVDPDAIFRVIQRHGFCEGIHAALCRGIGGVYFLADDSDKARGVKNATFARHQRSESVARGVKNTLQI